MYGLVIEGLFYMIREHWGEDMLKQVVKKAMLENVVLSSHEIFSERIAPNILAAISEISGTTFHEVALMAGKYFVHFTSQYGYDGLLNVSGRRFGDFITGLDNMHEFFKFSYPKIKPPSFYCEKIDSRGVILHYRSRRVGYTSYVMGQLMEIAQMFYKLELSIKVMKKEEKRGISYVVMRLDFENRDYKADRSIRKQIIQLSRHLTVDSISFLAMFPFYIVFNKTFTVQLAGKAVLTLVPDLLGKKLNDEFDLVIPLVKFTYEALKAHQSNIFKLVSYNNIKRQKLENVVNIKLDDVLVDKVQLPTGGQDQEAGNEVEQELAIANGLENFEDEVDRAEEGYPLTLRGQMIYIRRSEVFLYLATCEVQTLDQMFDSGICVSDYSIADCNRDMIMVTVQQSDELKNRLNAEREKSLILKQNMAKLDIARQETKELLSQMMPKSVAALLVTSSGLEPPNIVQNFSDATVCFAKIKDFARITSKLCVMAIVTLLNNVYNLFDGIVERHGVYKVETIGESYMISGGVPNETPYHTEYAADTALDMVMAMNYFFEETTNEQIFIKLGMHSGPVVGGIIGFKAPRYCLIGDAVNTASRMESHNAVPKTVMASYLCRDKLEYMAPTRFRFASRGMIDVKGKGQIETFEIVSKAGPARCETDPIIEDDDDLLTGVYTPVDDMKSRASDVASRMSVSHVAGSGATSRATSRASSRSSVGSVIDRALKDLDTAKLSDIHEEEVITSTASVKVKSKNKIKTSRRETSRDVDSPDLQAMVKKAAKEVKPQVVTSNLASTNGHSTSQQPESIPPTDSAKVHALDSNVHTPKASMEAPPKPPEPPKPPPKPPTPPVPNPIPAPVQAPTTNPVQLNGHELSSKLEAVAEEINFPGNQPGPGNVKLVSKDSIENLLKGKETQLSDAPTEEGPPSRKSSLESVDINIKPKVTAEPAPSESLSQLQQNNPSSKSETANKKPITQQPLPSEALAGGLTVNSLGLPDGRAPTTKFEKPPAGMLKDRRPSGPKTSSPDQAKKGLITEAAPPPASVQKQNIQSVKSAATPEILEEKPYPQISEVDPEEPDVKSVPIQNVAEESKPARKAKPNPENPKINTESPNLTPEFNPKDVHYSSETGKTFKQETWTYSTPDEKGSTKGSPGPQSKPTTPTAPMEHAQVEETTFIGVNHRKISTPRETADGGPATVSDDIASNVVVIRRRCVCRVEQPRAETDVCTIL